MRFNRIAFAGSGNVALHLANRLSEGGKEITGFLNRTHTDDLLLKSGVKVARSTSVDSFMSSPMDLIIIAVSDGEIEKVSKKLARYEIPMVHTSGAVSMDKIFRSNQSIGVFYPLQTLQKNRENQKNKIPICVDGSDDLMIQSLKDLASVVSDQVQRVTDEDRQWLHLSAVFLNNNINHLLARVKDLMDYKGLPMELLQPLLQATVEQCSTAHPAENQTGPALRGDELTRKIHHKLLLEFGDRQLIELYDYFWRNIASYHEQ